MESTPLASQLGLFFASSPLLVPHHERATRDDHGANANLLKEELAILQDLGLPAKSSLVAHNKPITVKHFSRLARLCSQLEREMTSPAGNASSTHTQAAITAYMDDSKYDKVMSKHAKSIARDLDDALQSGKLELAGRNLQSRDRMRLVSAFIWRNGSGSGSSILFAVNLTSAMGFREEDNAQLAMLIPRALFACTTATLTTLAMANTQASPVVSASVAYLAIHSHVLETVDCARCNVGDSGAALWGLSLHQPSSSSSSLTKLTLSRAKIGELGAMALAIGLSSEHCALEYLDLAGNQLGGKGVQYLGRALLENTRLRELVLNGNDCGSRGACALASALLHADCQLRVLHLEGNDIGPRGGQALSVGLARNTRLEELYLARNDLENKGTAPFGPCLETNRRLRVLDLSDCDMSDLGLAGLSLGLARNTSLEQLVCASQVIGDAGTCALAAGLMANNASALRILDLSQNMIRNAGAEALAEWLEMDNGEVQLESLLLSDNDVMDHGARRLGQCLANNAAYSRLQYLDLSGNPIAARVVHASLTRPVGEVRLTRVLVAVDGSRIARRNIRQFGAMISRYKMTGTYYVALMLFTLFSQWFDLALDVYVTYNQTVLAMQTRQVHDIVYAALLGLFAALPYVYVLVVFSRPDDGAADDSKWWLYAVLGRAKLVVINALQMRSAYEIYRSLHSELSTLAYSSVRLAQCVLGAMPQSLVQLHMLLSSPNLALIESAGGKLSPYTNWRLFSNLVSICVSFLTMSSTVSYLYEERFVLNWKKVDFHWEELTYSFGMLVAFAYHLAHYVFRAVFLVLVASLYGPVLGCGLVVLGLLVRLGLWRCYSSQRRKLFVVISYVVGVASWDKRAIARGVVLGVELVECCVVVATLWIPSDLIERIPRGAHYDLGFQQQEWLDLVRVIGPIVLTGVLAGAWLVSTYLYFAFVEQLHPYTDVDERCDMDHAERIAWLPFRMHGSSVVERRREMMRAQTNFRGKRAQQAAEDYDIL